MRYDRLFGGRRRAGWRTRRMITVSRAIRLKIWSASARAVAV